MRKHTSVKAFKLHTEKRINERQDKAVIKLIPKQVYSPYTLSKHCVQHEKPFNLYARLKKPVLASHYTIEDARSSYNDQSKDMYRSKS